MQFLKANTEVKVRIGPFVDVGDGFTPQTDIALSGDEAELLKHNGVATVDISGNTWAAVTNCRGWYDLTLTTTDTNTEGLLTVVVQDDSDCLPVFVHFMVLAEAAYDSLLVAKDTGYMTVNAPTKAEMDTAHALLATATNLGTVLTRLSATRAGYLDQLDFALQEAIAAIPTTAMRGTDNVVLAGPTKAEMDTAHALLATPAQVNTEVVDALGTDTIAELAQGIPVATPTIKTAIMLLYMALRNKLDVDADWKEIHNDAGTVICKKALTDDATTYSEAEAESG